MEIIPYTVIVTRVANKLNISASKVDEIVKDFISLLQEELKAPSHSRIQIPVIGTLFLRTLTLRSMVRRSIKALREGQHQESTLEKVKIFLRKILALRHEVYAYSKYRNRITQYKPTEGIVNPFSYKR